MWSFPLYFSEQENDEEEGEEDGTSPSLPSLVTRGDATKMRTTAMHYALTLQGRFAGPGPKMCPENYKAHACGHQNFGPYGWT